MRSSRHGGTTVGGRWTHHLQKRQRNTNRCCQRGLGQIPRGKVVVDKPPKYESQSSGIAEEVGKTIREFVLILKDVIETKAKMKINGNMALAPWMMRWAAMNVSRFQVGTDGMTAYERRRGRKCRVPMVCFGESVVQEKG